jgi:sugar/nucleoside kinase (ribokinase family)
VTVPDFRTSFTSVSRHRSTLTRGERWACNSWWSPWRLADEHAGGRRAYNARLNAPLLLPVLVLGAMVILNPALAKDLPDELLRHCHVVIPNEGELYAIGGRPRIRGAAARQRAASWLLERGVEAVVTTRGAQGADLYQSGLDVIHRPAQAVTVVDTSGAGDAFSAGFAVALARRSTLEEALATAARAAASACGHVGARSRTEKSQPR